MKVINNKKGSALLWCILLIIILTILLSSVLAATYAYYSYTMRTVKRQQAYFTARSAVSMLLEELTSEEQVRTSGSYAESTISVLPTDKGASHAVTVSDFGFAAEMGTAEATLVRSDDDEVNIEVTAYYPDNVNGEKYVMKATVSRQPLYFGGIAVKNLTLNGKLTLGENTDFYWNNTDLFNTAGNGTSFKNNGGGTLSINGNLVTKGDATITPGTVVAGRNFYGTASFSGTGLHSKKIWSPSEYIISNKTLQVDDDENLSYESNIANTISNLTNYTVKYCNSNGNTPFGAVSLTGFDLASLLSNIPLLGPIFDDIQDENFRVGNSNSNALAIRYIKILSATKDVNNAIESFKTNNPLSIFITPLLNMTQNVLSSVGRTCLDVSYVDFTSNDESNRSDEVVPLTYLFVDGGDHTALKVRVRYGKDPGRHSTIGQIANNITSNVGNFLNTIFDIHNKPSYVVTYLEKNGRLELGYDDDGRRSLGTPQNLIFLYSVYGGDNTTVVLHDGVIVVGEIICDNLIIEGDAKIIYSSINGGQIAKQKIAEYWAVSNYTD